MSKFGRFKSSIVLGIVLSVLSGALLDTIVQIVQKKAFATDTAVKITVIAALLALSIVILALKGGVEQQLTSLRKSHELLANMSPFHMMYYELSPGTHHSPDRDAQAVSLYEAATAVINSASSSAEVLALNSFVEIGEQPGDAHVQEASKKYLQAIDDMIVKVAKYKRLLQLEPGDLATVDAGESIAGLFADNYRYHYRKTIEARAANSNVTVEAVEARYPVSFVLVKEENAPGGQIIWQMNQHVKDAERTDRVELTGVFIVNDPEGVVFQTLYKWFANLDLAPKKVLELRHLVEDDAPAGTASVNGQSGRRGTKVLGRYGKNR